MFEIYQIQYFKIIIYIIVFALHSVVNQFILTSQPSLHLCPTFGEADWTRKWRKYVIVRHNSHGPQPCRPKQACNKSKYYILIIVNIIELIHSHIFHAGYLHLQHTQHQH
jgi:hypothetical protein